MRLPDVLKANPITQALFKLSASVSERKYRNVYSRTEEAQNIIESTPISGVDLAVVVNGLLTKFLG